MKKFLPSLLCIAATLCLGAALTACGGNGDKKEEIPLTAETDFTALDSEKVDANGWKKALSLKDYTVNFTNGLTLTDDHYKDYIFKYNINELTYYTLEFEAGVKLADDVYSYYYYANPFTDDDGTTYEGEGFWDRADKEDSRYDSFVKNHNLYMIMYYPDFSSSFGSFTYDETKHSYTCKSITANTLINYDGGEYGPDNTTYTDVELKIVNGRLAYFSAIHEDYKKIESVFYDFGTTAITYKDVEEKIGFLE